MDRLKAEHRKNHEIYRTGIASEPDKYVLQPANAHSLTTTLAQVEHMIQSGRLKQGVTIQVEKHKNTDAKGNSYKCLVVYLADKKPNAQKIEKALTSAFHSPQEATLFEKLKKKLRRFDGLCGLEPMNRPGCPATNVAQKFEQNFGQVFSDKLGRLAHSMAPRPPAAPVQAAAPQPAATADNEKARRRMAMHLPQTPDFSHLGADPGSGVASTTTTSTTTTTTTTSTSSTISAASNSIEQSQ